MIKYLSRGEFAERIGVEYDSLNRVELPEPDAMIGEKKGWLIATVDRWQRARPGKGWWGKGDKRRMKL